MKKTPDIISEKTWNNEQNSGHYWTKIAAIIEPLWNVSAQRESSIIDLRIWENINSTWDWLLAKSAVKCC